MMVASGVSYWDAIAPGLVMGLIAVGVLPWLDRNNTLARTVGIGVCLFLGWRYMFWRFTETMPPLSEPLDFSIGLVFTLVEMLSMLGTTLALFFLTRTKDRTPEANANVPWLKSLPKQPLVDVLVHEQAIVARGRSDKHPKPRTDSPGIAIRQIFKARFNDGNRGKLHRHLVLGEFLVEQIAVVLHAA
jgi:hypothetical protein